MSVLFLTDSGCQLLLIECVYQLSGFFPKRGVVSLFLIEGGGLPVFLMEGVCQVFFLFVFNRGWLSLVSLYFNRGLLSVCF